MTFIKNCLFCQIGSQKDNPNIIRKFKHCFAIYDKFPVNPGHVLIIPFHHTETWFTATEDIRLDIILALHDMKSHLDHNFSPPGYNMGVNCGLVAGQTVFHLHMHLIPRYVGDMDNPRGGIRGVIPYKQKY
ncbi:MAG: HIT family protein [Alphaproteobacteria bacterium]|nr:HIT family protein [Alphaproteobacteria bacterium]